MFAHCWKKCCCPWWGRRGQFEYKDGGDADKVYKLVLVGGRVGKTTLRHGFAKTDYCRGPNVPAVPADADYSVREMDVGGEPVSVQICEYPTDADYQSPLEAPAMAPLQLADGIFLAYDVTNRFISYGQASLELLTDIMLTPEILANLCRAAHVVVIGTKNDLEDGDREISAEEGKAFADGIGAGFQETSTRAGTNISKALFLMVVTVSESARVPGDKRRSRRLKMPWTDPKRLRQALEKYQGGKTSYEGRQAISVGRLGAADEEKNRLLAGS